MEHSGADRRLQRPEKRQRRPAERQRSFPSEKRREKKSDWSGEKSGENGEKYGFEVATSVFYISTNVSVQYSPKIYSQVSSVGLLAKRKSKKEKSTDCSGFETIQKEGESKRRRKNVWNSCKPAGLKEAKEKAATQ